MYYQALKSELTSIRLAIRDQVDHIECMKKEGDIPHWLIKSAEIKLESLWDDYATLNYQLNDQER